MTLGSSATGADAPKKVVVMVYFPSDDLTKTSAAKAIEKLRAEKCGYEVVDILIDTNQQWEEKVADALAGKEIPKTAPIFLHGHGMADKDDDFALIAKKPKLDTKTRSLLPRQLIKGRDVVKKVRETLKYNPIWISSCQSGSACFLGDRCLGTSCLEKEDSYGNDEKIEGTLGEMVSLLCDPKKFTEISGGLKILSPQKLTEHFCKVFGEKVEEEIFSLGEKEKFNKAFEEAKRKHDPENVKTEKRENVYALIITYPGTACLKTESGKTQSPRSNNFRLYLPDYVPKDGELEGLPPGSTKEKEHAK